MATSRMRMCLFSLYDLLKASYSFPALISSCWHVPRELVFSICEYSFFLQQGNTAGKCPTYGCQGIVIFLS